MNHRSLRICFVGTPWLAVGPSRGGIEKTLFELSRILAHGHQVNVVCPEPLEASPSAVQSGVAFQYARVREVPKYPIRDRLDLTFEGVRLLLRFVVATILMAERYLDLYRKNGLDVTYFADKNVAVLVLAMLRRRRRGVFIVAEHNIWPWLHATPKRGSARLRYHVQIFLGRLACGLSDSIHVNSQSLLEKMAERGIDRKRMFPIPNGTEILSGETLTTPISRPIKIAFVGRLVEEKGIRILIDSIRILNERRSDIRFEIFGDGPLRSLIMEAGLKGCTFWGERPRREVLESLKSVHIVLFLSPVENIPSVALLEAMALGKAVVVTDVGDTSRFLSNERNALLCRAEPFAVSEAVARLLADGGLYSNITEGARTLAASYSWEEIARRHMLHFESTLSSETT